MAIWYTKKKKQKKNDQKLFVQCYFDGDIKLLVCINICIRNFSQCYFEEDTYYFQLYQHYNLCQCLFEINKMYCYSYLFALFQSVLLKLQGLSIMPEQFRTGSQSKKCYKMIEWKQRVQKLRRFDVETTQKNPHGELIDISSILKVESTSNRCHNFHVDSPFKIDVISTNFPRGISTSNRWRIDEDVSIWITHLAWCQYQFEVLFSQLEVLHQMNLVFCFFV